MKRSLDKSSLMESDGFHLFKSNKVGVTGVLHKARFTISSFSFELYEGSYWFPKDLFIIPCIFVTMALNFPKIITKKQSKWGIFSSLAVENVFLSLDFFDVEVFDNIWS